MKLPTLILALLLGALCLGWLWGPPDTAASLAPGTVPPAAPAQGEGEALAGPALEDRQGPAEEPEESSSPGAPVRDPLGPRPVYLETTDGGNLAPLLRAEGFVFHPVLEVRATDAAETIGRQPEQEVLAHFERFEPRDRYGGPSRHVGDLQAPRRAPRSYALVMEDRVLLLLPGDSDELRFRLSPGLLNAVFGSLQVSCVGEDGQLLGAGSASLELPWSGAVQVPLESGRVHLAGLPPAPMRLHLGFEGVLSQSIDLELGPGEAKDLGVLTFTPALSLSGRVLGDPAVHVRVVATLLEGADRILSTTSETFTDEQGRFEFPGLAPGLYSVRVGRPSFNRKILISFLAHGVTQEPGPDEEERRQAAVLTRDGPVTLPLMRAMRPMERVLEEVPCSAALLVDLTERSASGLELRLVPEVPVIFLATAPAATQVRVLDEHGVAALEFSLAPPEGEFEGRLVPGSYRLIARRDGVLVSEEPVLVGPAGATFTLR